MKKIFPFILAALVFVVALAMNQSEKHVRVVVAATDLEEGQILAESDVVVKEIPSGLAPQGAVGDVQSLVGQRLRVARSAGDPILPSHLGGAALELQPDERAVALSVVAAQGLAGWLKPGDRVGLTVVINANQQTYAKYLAGGLRVLWVDPAFRRAEAAAPPTASSGDGLPGGGVMGMGTTGGIMMTDATGATRGLVVLAIPVAARTVLYDFSMYSAESVAQPVYLLDILPALAVQGAQFGLVLEPEGAQEVITSGVALQALAITPGPTMTPTPVPTLTPTPTRTRSPAP